MYRKYCTDWSFVADRELAENPLTNPYGRDLILSKNLLSYGDFASAQTGPWLQWKDPHTDWQLLKDSLNNSYLQFACAADCSANRLGGVYQDVDVSGLRGNLTLRYGAIMKAQTSANASIALHFFDASGAYIKQAVTPAATLHAAWQHVDGSYPWDFSATPLSKIRFQIYTSEAGVLQSLDEAYLTPSK